MSQWEYCHDVVIDGVKKTICKPLYTPINRFHWDSPIYELYKHIYDRPIPDEIQVARQVETLSTIGLLANKLPRELRQTFHDGINNSLSTMFSGRDVKMQFPLSDEQENIVDQNCSDCG